MKSLLAHIHFTLATTIGFMFLTLTPAWPGGSDEGPDVHHDDGPSYFGFVKDTSGKAIPDAKVTVAIKGLGSVITRTNAAGSYKLPGFGKELSPDKITISCSKDGFKQTRAFTRTPLNKKPLTAIEIECTMQRIATK